MKLYNLTREQFIDHLKYFIEKADYVIRNNAYQHKVFKKGQTINLLAINFGHNSATNRIFIEEYMEGNKENIYARENYKRTISNFINWKTINNIELIVDDDGLPLNVKYITHDNIAIIEIKFNELGLLESFQEIKIADKEE